MKAFVPYIDAILPEIIELRRELHRHPEIRFQEQLTSDRLARFLDEAHVPHTRGWAGGTGIVAELKGSSGVTVALRADMDGLELQEMTGLPYASAVAERMHACGHDGHMACLCGAVKTLAQFRAGLVHSVRFVFQPGEEIGGGGRMMVQEGAADGAAAVFALHGWPELPCGHIGYRSGLAMAGADWFAITVRGKGCHGAHPDQGVDPVIAAAHIVVAIQSIVSREIEPTMPAVVTVAKFNAGLTENIIPETARLEGTIRTFSADARELAVQAIRRIAEGTASAYRAEADVEIGTKHYIPLVNDAHATERARDILTASLGPGAVTEIDRPSMGAEDFAYYLEKVPGTFLMLGLGREGQTSSPLHSPNFDFNDDAIRPGILALTALATQY